MNERRVSERRVDEHRVDAHRVDEHRVDEQDGPAGPAAGDGPAPRWLSAEETRAWLGYRRMRALLDLQISRDLSRDSGLSDADYDVLSTVSEAPEQMLRLGDLAAHMLWSKSRLSHHISRMEQRGLVARQDCAEDGRGAMLTLTEAGWEAIRSAAPKHVDSVRRHFIGLLSTGQLQMLGELTETVVAHLGGTAMTGTQRSKSG